ncbi:MAG: hypothetical protein WCX28_12580, partial [Bacteriovoracaceae bacterium]
VEGAFYVWKKTEIEQILTADEARIFCHHYSVDVTGNVHSDPHQEFTGKNILFNPFTVEQTAEQLSVSAEEVRRLLVSSRQKLFVARKNRYRPLRDDKVLTSWNGLMIGACARGASALNNKNYLQAAERAAKFVYATLYDREKKTLFRRFRDGEVKFEAHLDDYAFVVSGLIDLYGASFDPHWLQWAEELTGSMITLFWDSAEGGFFDMSGKDPSILVRMKEAYDGAEPTGNSVAVMNLLQLFHFTNNEQLLSYAVKSLKYFCALLEQSPQIMPRMMAAVEYFLAVPEHLVITVQNVDDAKQMIDIASAVFRPYMNIVMMDEQGKKIFVSRFPFMSEMVSKNGRATAYLCMDHMCQQPTVEPEELLRLLDHN